MPSYSEEDLQDALNRLHQKRGSIRRVARDFGIPASTLRARIKGSRPRKEAFETHQLISRAQDDKLTQWILTQVALTLPPTPAQIREFVARILEAQGDPRSVGKGWIRRFLRRNPILLTQRGKRIDSVRINGATEPVIKAWFSHLNIPAIKDIKPGNRWNFDEFGLMEGQGSNGLVVGIRGRKAVLRKQPRSRQWSSFLECISATGVSLSPAVIFKGKSVQQK
ncbi:hypothetical protein VTI74DRAFT_8819 [Chaetomium olivicolor]